MNRDEERIEEEIAGAERPPRPRNMSAAYLSQALDALYATGDARALYRSPVPTGDDKRSMTQRALATMQARYARRMLCRSVVLFAAFAAESYVNEFLAVLMADRRTRLRAIDRWPTPKKYLDATREAYGEQLFFDDREAMPVIRELFVLRNKLAHPRPGFGPAEMFQEDDEPEQQFAPPKLAEFVVMVGGGGHLLVLRAYGFDAVDAVASATWFGRDAIRAYAQRAVAMPLPGQASEPPLLQQAMVRVSELHSPALNDPNLSINRLRAARQQRLNRAPDQK